MTKQKNRNTISAWLFGCAGLVFIMVIVGAITRLTESGLSMVEWRPLIGILPPLNETEWRRVFDLYRETPEFQKKNFWMNIGDFKTIFFWEWFHRLFGRLIGIAYGLPLLFFWIKGMIPAGFKKPLIGLLVLGGLQGAMGWYMVKSGLVDMPAVSHYRLAAHLGLAFIIFAYLVSVGMSVKGYEKKPNAALFKHALVTLLFVSITIVWGAYTAGMDAGLIYNDTFPKMGGAWLPDDFWQYEGVLKNTLENPVGIQWAHRWLAMITVGVVVSLWAHAIIKKHNIMAVHALVGIALLQMILGIITLLTNVWLPIAVMHQAGALTLLGTLIICLEILSPQIGHAKTA